MPKPEWMQATGATVQHAAGAGVDVLG